MKKRFMQFAGLVLAAALLVPAGPARAAAVSVNPTVRVGLAFGGNALPGANLQNEEGAGYRLGYYDTDMSFVQLGYTAETQISVVKTQNVWFGYLSDQGRNGYSDAISSDVAVGCYHVALPGAYADFESASAAAAGVSGGFPAWVNGAYEVRAGAYLSQEEAQSAAAAMGGSPAGTGSSAVSVVKTGTSRILFQFDGGGSQSLGVQPGLDGGVEPVTWFAGYRYHGGFQYQRVSGGNLTVSNVIPLEDYVRGVLPYEMGNSWPLEALKAQAVCARTYAMSKIQASKHAGQGFDICNTTDCQVYQGVSSANATTDQAAAETYGLYVWYGDTLAETSYSSCDGGATEDASVVWGGKNSPWLTGVADPYEAAVADKIEGYSWSYTFTAQELTDRLNAKGYGNTGVVSVQITSTALGNVRSLTFTDSSGSNRTFTGDNARIFLGLSSNRYTVSAGGAVSGGGSGGGGGTGGVTDLTGAYAIDGQGNISPLPGGDTYVITGTGIEAYNPSGTAAGSPAPTTPPTSAGVTGSSFTFTGTGKGHNVGMSQWGANAMAKQGFTYDEILHFYFTGIDVR